MKSAFSSKQVNKKKIKTRSQPKVFLILLTSTFVLIIARLFFLQILQGRYYSKLSDENRIRLIASPPRRGRFLDNSGKILVDNRLSYSLLLDPSIVPPKLWPSYRDKISNLLNIDARNLDISYSKGVQKSDLRITLIRDLSDQNIIKIKEQQNHLTGISLNQEFVRSYPYGSLAAHTFGYTQLITNSEYNKLSKKGYLLNDRIGRAGLEAAYETHLRGQWGGEMLEVDSEGAFQRSLGFKSPEAGKDLKLTIDLALQKAAEKALENISAGAIVALNPNTGALLAVASKPTYPPDFFVRKHTSQKEYDETFSTKNLPFLSRALNAYDPGSTWKIVTGAAGLESGKFPPEVTLNTFPCIPYGSHCFPEHNKKGFGLLGYEDAYRVSSNTFFYQVGFGSGSDELYKAAKKLGFDQFTGVELKAEESKGLVGNSVWAENGRGWAEPGTTPWIPEDIASASIGQSVVQVTPLQLARAYAVFANGGYLVTPHFVDGNKDWEKAPYRQKVEFASSTIETIRNGLRQVVARGTGMMINFNIPDLPPVAGKTGTAEDSSGGEDHAWFACFAPFEASEIVVIAFAQNTPGGGSVHALPLARQVLEVWNLIR